MKQCSGCIEKDRFRRFLFVVRGYQRAASMEVCFAANCNFRPSCCTKPVNFALQKSSTGVAWCSGYERR
jgi:putative component of membrane protein insertase Oxa1/YidC/SpoIIIJ protein YidD